MSTKEQATAIKPRAVSFRNYSNEDFVHTWDGVEYSFPAQQAIMIQDYLAIHFAKHLAQRELLRAGKNPSMNKTEFTKEMNKCFVHNSETLVADTSEQLSAKLLNINEVSTENKVEMKRYIDCQVQGCQFVAKSESMLAAHLKSHDEQNSSIDDEDKEFPDLTNEAVKEEKIDDKTTAKGNRAK